METSHQEQLKQFEQSIALYYSSGILYQEFQRECNKRFIMHVLRACNGNQCRAARELGMHRNTLSRTIAELGLARDDWDPKRQLSGRFLPRHALGPKPQTRMGVGA